MQVLENADNNSGGDEDAEEDSPRPKTEPDDETPEPSPRVRGINKRALSAMEVSTPGSAGGVGALAGRVKIPVTGGLMSNMSARLLTLTHRRKGTPRRSPDC